MVGTNRFKQRLEQKRGGAGGTLERSANLRLPSGRHALGRKDAKPPRKTKRRVGGRAVNFSGGRSFAFCQLLRFSEAAFERGSYSDTPSPTLLLSSLRLG